jgi:hypothetical protein
LNRASANQVSPNQTSIKPASIGRNTHSRRVAKIQERFNALPLDVQQEIMRLREPETRVTLSMASTEKQSEAA